MMGNMSYHPNPGSLPEERYGHTDALVEAAAQRARLQDELDSVRQSKLGAEQAGVASAGFGRKATTFLDLVTLRRMENRCVRMLNQIDSVFEAVPVDEDDPSKGYQLVDESDPAQGYRLRARETPRSPTMSVEFVDG